MKISIIGSGLRTPLLIHGLAHSALNDSDLTVYDIAPERAELMASLGHAIAAGTPLRIVAAPTVADAVRDAHFVISSIRPGGIEARARDERITLECGLAGQETTGPAGFAMALRTVPIALEHARLVERLSPQAWIINFTNPAGLITQAITGNTKARVVGICDTPAELFFRISLALERPLDQVECDYLGLNHLGWVRSVHVRNEDGTRQDVTSRLLDDHDALGRLYPAELFSQKLISALRLIPTEYLYFYYNQRTAYKHQVRARATRGGELAVLNRRVLEELELSLRRGNPKSALQTYRAYLNRRNASYMHLEGSGGSAFDVPEVDWDPFLGATGYHRIAVDTILALCSAEPRRLVLSVLNGTSIRDFAADDIVEVPCLVDRAGPRPMSAGSLPEVARGLAQSVKTYERLAIQAAISRDRPQAVLALFTNPIVADWSLAEKCADRLIEEDQPARADDGRKRPGDPIRPG